MMGFLNHYMKTTTISVSAIQYLLHRIGECELFTYEECLQTEPLSELDIAIIVADHIRSRRVDGEIHEGLDAHADLRLAAAALVIGMVGTVIDRIQMSAALFLDQLAQSLMDLCQLLMGNKSAADA